MKEKKLNLNEKQEECFKCETASLEITAGGDHVKCSCWVIMERNEIVQNVICLITFFYISRYLLYSVGIHLTTFCIKTWSIIPIIIVMIVICLKYFIFIL